MTEPRWVSDYPDADCRLLVVGDEGVAKVMQHYEEDENGDTVQAGWLHITQDCNEFPTFDTRAQAMADALNLWTEENGDAATADTVPPETLPTGQRQGWSQPLEEKGKVRNGS